MDRLRIRRRQGIRQIGEGLGTLDREVFEAIAESPSPLLDAVMPRLTRATDHSNLWFAIAAALAAFVEQVREALPCTEIVQIGGGDDIEKVLRAAARRAEVLAVGGGDGTVSCAAGVAVEAGIPLAVFPCGTFNHFAKDIGCDTATKTVDAIRRGSVACVDVVAFNEGRMVINTASIGAYPKLVQTRETLEHKIGKPLAGLYAMLHTLRHDEPVRIRYDNKSLQTSLFFLGNSTYLPSVSLRLGGPGWTTASSTSGSWRLAAGSADCASLWP